MALVIVEAVSASSNKPPAGVDMRISQVSDADFDDDTDRDSTIERATEVLEALQTGVVREGVFSSNEDLEEIDTHMVPLLAADFYLGSLVTKLPFSRPETRLGMLKRAEALLFKYLDTCERLDLFEEADLAAWQSMLKDGERSSAGAVRVAVPREQKVQRFRRQQRIRQKMDEIERELDDANAADGRDHSGREGRMRERSMLLLASLAADAMDELSGVSMEMEMLEHRLKAVQHTQGTDAGREQNQQGRQCEASTRQEHGGAGSRNTGLEVTHISRVGGSLNIRKEGIRAGVFKPTVAPPTMTVEEYGEIELERARQRQEVDDKNNRQPSTSRRYDQLEMDGDEDEQELVEASVYRDREWDDWKDSHPKGSGNKGNKII